MWRWWWYRTADGVVGRIEEDEEEDLLAAAPGIEIYITVLFQVLKSPGLGRACSWAGPGLRFFEAQALESRARTALVILMYRLAHCCKDVASIADMRLITRLRNHSELTQTAYVGGENAGGWVTAEGIHEGDILGLARS